MNILKNLGIFCLGTFLFTLPAMGHERCGNQNPTSSLQILSGSQVTVAGGTEPIPNQTVPLGRAPGSDSFTTLDRIVLPSVDFAFGQLVELVHEGPTLGTFLPGTDDHIDIDFFLKVTDDDGVSVEIPFLLTTRSIVAFNCGLPIPIEGISRDGSGAFLLRGAGGVPSGTGSQADCARITIEISGLISPTDGDGDLIEDFVDDCPGDPDPGQVDSDGDGVGDVCDNCQSTPNTGQRDSDGDGQGDLCDPWKINFQPSGSVVPPGYSGDFGGVFDCGNGSGWETELSVNTRDRGGACSDPRLATLIFSDSATWEIDLPNADYQVTAAVGDCSYAQGPHLLIVEGVTIIENVSTDPGSSPNVTGAGTVQVRDGRLTIQIGDGISVTTLNYIDIAPLDQASQPGTLCSVNFQPAGSDVPDSWFEDNGFDFTQSRGFGWDQPVETRDRELTCEQPLDTFVFTTDSRLWEMEIRNGFYEVTVGIGDESFLQGPHAVTVEGQTFFDGATTSAGEHQIITRPLQVQDGRLSMWAGGAGGNSTADFFTVSTAPPDIDGDTVLNSDDNCPFGFNPGQEEFDGDGVGDACDSCSDLDDDGFGAGFPMDTCPLDCDDTSALVYMVPVEVTGITAIGSATTTVQWDDQRPAAGFGTNYEIATSVLSSLSGADPFAGACIIGGINGPSYLDERVSPPGDGFYYLVRANNGCGDGGWGAGTSNPNHRESLETAPACP